MKSIAFFEILLYSLIITALLLVAQANSSAWLLVFAPCCVIMLFNLYTLVGVTRRIRNEKIKHPESPVFEFIFLRFYFLNGAFILGLTFLCTYILPELILLVAMMLVGKIGG